LKKPIHGKMHRVNVIQRSSALTSSELADKRVAGAAASSTRILCGILCLSNVFRSLTDIKADVEIKRKMA